MSDKSKYFIRILTSDIERFMKHVESEGIDTDLLSHDLNNGKMTSMFTASMDDESALAMKLTFPLEGCIKF